MTRHFCSSLAGWAGLLTVAVLAGAGWWAWRQGWRLAPAAPAESPPAEVVLSAEPSARLSPQARQNLGLTSRPLRGTTYWRTLDLPGVIVDRPGLSDRGIVAPVAGAVVEVHAFPGDTVEPDAPLVTLRMVSESLHAAQLQLFQATREIEIAERQRARLAGLAQSGAVAQSRILELDNLVERAQATVEAYRQDLHARGMSAEGIAAAARGEFLTELIVRASRAPTEPPRVEALASEAASPSSQPPSSQPPFRFEVQSLDVQLGQQVQPGQVLCHLADHRVLLIEGRGFEADLPLVQRAVEQGWPVAVDFAAGESDEWPPLPDAFAILHVANVVDPETHTFAFFLRVENPWRTYTHEGATRVLWRLRPGSHVRLRVPIERLDNVLVVPRGAVVWEGPEAYVFRQNGDLFDRRAVHVVHQDRTAVVLANDGSIRAGFYIAQGSAAALQRVLKAQASSGLPAGFHVHADGSVHGAH